jgi:hypothetical protein
MSRAEPDALGREGTGTCSANPWRAGHTTAADSDRRVSGLRREAAMTLLRITDDSDRAEIAEALVNCCRTAIRAPHVFGKADHPSAWDKAHATLDVLLDEWVKAR